MKIMFFRNKPLETVYIFVSFICLALSIGNIFHSYKAYSFITILLFSLLFVLTIKYRNFSLYQMFLITFFIFLLSRPFLDLIGAYDLRTMDYFKSETMSNEVAKETVRTLLNFLTGTSYAWLIFEKNINTRKATIKTIDEKQKLNKILKVLFCIYLPIFIAKLLYTITNVRNLGYAALFNGNINSVKYPILFTGAGTITELLYLFIIYYNREKKDFIKYTTLYVIVAIVKAFTGQRSTAFLALLFAIYMYSTYYSEIKIFNKKIVLTALLTPFAIEYLARIRNGIFSLEGILTDNVLFLMLKNMGISVNVIAYYITFKGTFSNKIPFFLGYIVDALQKEPAGQTLEDISTGNYLGDHLTYNISETAFFSGRGTGTSIVAEAYDLCFGKHFLIVLFAFIMTFLVLWICSSRYKSIYRFILSFFLSIDFIYSPRWSVLKSIPTCIIGLTICFILNFFSYKAKLRKRIDYYDSETNELNVDISIIEG